MERDLKVSRSPRSGLWNAATPIQSNGLRRRPRQGRKYSQMLCIRSDRTLLPRLTWVKAAGVRRVHSQNRGLLGFLRFSRHQSSFEGTRTTPVPRKLPRWLPPTGELFRVRGRGQELSSSRPLPAWSRTPLGAAASPSGQTIAGSAWSYIRIVPLLHPEVIQTRGAGRGL
jgi:hypothetical protein